MISISRLEVVQTSRIIVVKVGTNVLTTANGLLKLERIRKLAQDLSVLIRKGRKVILVSSGAVGAGIGELGLRERPSEHRQLQAIAAIGQTKLMQAYEDALAPYHVLPGQVLLTADDLAHRQQYLNIRNTFSSLLDYKALPIVNENDTVSVDELHSTFGDNDRLAALVANLFAEPLLILLTDVDGLYTGDPALSDSKLIPVVDRWSANLMEMVAEKRSTRSKGGMSSKLTAAKMVTSSGGSVIIANGDDEEVLKKIVSGQETGTVFFPSRSTLARKRWIGYAVLPKGTLIVDDGAANVLVNKGKSLLPVGVLSVSGKFDKGDIVSIVNTSGKEIARGLSNYSLRDVAALCGKKTKDIPGILGYQPYEEIIHRDNIQIIE